MPKSNRRAPAHLPASALRSAGACLIRPCRGACQTLSGTRPETMTGPCQRPLFALPRRGSRKPPARGVGFAAGHGSRGPPVSPNIKTSKGKSPVTAPVASARYWPRRGGAREPGRGTARRPTAAVFPRVPGLGKRRDSARGKSPLYERPPAHWAKSAGTGPRRSRSADRRSAPPVAKPGRTARGTPLSRGRPATATRWGIPYPTPSP